MTLLRFGASLLMAAALILVPSAAFADRYPPNPTGLIISDTNPEPGQPFEVIVDTRRQSDTATLTITSDDADNSDIEIAGTQSMTKGTNAEGVATFTVTLWAEGVYTAIGEGENGVVGRGQIVVGDGVPGGNGAARSGTTEGSDSGAGFGLGDTGAGSSSALLAGGGVLLLAGGGAALLYSRRRKMQLA